MKIKIFFLIALINLISCGKNKENKADDLDFNSDYELLSQYFASVPHGVISTSDEFKFILKHPLTNELSSEQIKSLIKFDPTVKGTTSVSNNSIIEFIPDHSLIPNQQYTITFNLDALQSPHYKGKISYNVMTLPQEVKMNNEGFLLESNRALTHYLRVELADNIIADEFIKCFKSNATSVSSDKVSGKNLLLSFRFDNGYNKDNFIKYDLSHIHIKEQNDIKLYLPGQEFEVTTSSHRQESKELNLYFSQILDDKMDLSGIITLNAGSFTYSVNNNILSIYYTLSSNESKKELKISSLIKSKEGKKLKSDYSQTIYIKPQNPEVKFLQTGNYLPGISDFKIPIMTRNLNSIQLAIVEVKQQHVPYLLIWNDLSYLDLYTLRMFGKLVYDENVKLNQGEEDQEGWIIHAIDLTERIKKNPGSLYYVSIDFAPSDTKMDCKQDLLKLKYYYKTPTKKDFAWKSGNRYQYYGYYDYEDYDWLNRNNPCRLEFYTSKYSVNNTFLCTDYGIIAKKAGDDYQIHVFDLVTLKPVTNATVEAYDLQSDALAKAQTDQKGLAIFKSYDVGVYAVKVTKGNHVVWLPLDEYKNNNLTEFDISGTRSDAESQLFVYTDREIYRPGDSIHVDLMVNRRIVNIPDGVPIMMSFYNVDNLKINEQLKSFHKNKNLIYNFSTATTSQSKTGNYLMVFKFGPIEISKRIRIETIKPNTTSASFTIEGAKDKYIYGQQISGRMKLESLTGFPVKSANVKIFAKFRPIQSAFTKFTGYHFDRLSQLQSENDVLAEGFTDEGGMIAINSNLDLKNFNTPLGMNLEIESILPGGGMNKEGKSFVVYPFNSYIGIKNNKGSGWGESFLTTEKPAFEIVNIDAGQKNIAQNTVFYRVYKHEKYWWLDKYTLSTSGNYMQENYWSVVEIGNIKINNGKAKLSLKNLTKEGGYKVEVIDEASNHVTESYFNITKEGSWIPGSEPYILNFDLDKPEYNSNEKMVVMLPPLEGAKVLISIEQGYKIIHQQWEECSKNSKPITLNINEDWVPNVYVHLTLVQGYKDNANDLPLRMYGIRQARINYQEKALAPIIQTNETYESNKEYKIKISEELGRHMEYTLAIVDEGLLNLTGFKTPDPQQHFTGKFPLLTKTWDIYIYLVKYFKAKYAGIISVGGDGTYNPDVLPEVERFKPVAQHFGPFKLDAGKSNQHTIRIPNYIGRLRIMVVACNEKRFGSTEKFVSVKNPIMIQAQLPRSLNITDQFNLPVTVLKTDNTIQSAKLTAQVDAKSITGLISPVDLNLRSKDQVIYNYTIKVGEWAGSTKFRFRVDAGNKFMADTTEIAINYPNSYEQESTFLSIAPGESKELLISPKGFPEVFRSEILVAGIKLPNFVEYSHELISYPYGCLEQITSAGFSQLHLDELLDLSADEKRKRREHIESVLTRYNAYRLPDGRFNSWLEGNYYNLWSDLWAGNFLITSRDKDMLRGRDQLLDGWISYHSKYSSRFSAKNLSSEYIYENEVFQHAYRLYLLAKAGSPNKSAMNVFSMDLKSKNPMVYWFMAGAYKYAGFNTKAIDFVKEAESAMLQNYSQYVSYYYGSDCRNKAFIVEILTQFPELKSKLNSYYDNMVSTFNDPKWKSTQDMGACFAAISAYASVNKMTVSDITYTISKGNKTETFSHRSNISKSYKLKSTDIKNKMVIKNTGNNPVNIIINQRYISKEMNKPSASSNLEMNVSYTGMTKSPEGQYRVKAGQSVDVSIKIKNTQSLPVKDLALNLKVPSGFELINPRVYDNMNDADKEKYQYQDFNDDRVYTFFNLDPGASKSFTFRTKAAFTGNFYIPPVICENMYDSKIFARSSSERVEINGQ